MLPVKSCEILETGIQAKSHLWGKLPLKENQMFGSPSGEVNLHPSSTSWELYIEHSQPKRKDSRWWQMLMQIHWYLPMWGSSDFPSHIVRGGGKKFVVFLLVRVTIMWTLFGVLENRLQVRKVLAASPAFYSPLLLEMVICKSCLVRDGSLKE